MTATTQQPRRPEPQRRPDEDPEIPKIIHIPGDVATIIRAENESLASLAHINPRNEYVLIKTAIERLRAYPEYAGRAYYSIPYVDRRKRRITLVEGLSIGASVDLARHWRNNMSLARCIADDETGWTFEGVFVDYETLQKISRPHRESKLAKKHGGTGWYTLDERRQQMAYGAGASKAQRNAILKGLPFYLLMPYFAAAQECVAGAPLDDPAPRERVEKCVASFADLGVGVADLETYVTRINGVDDRIAVIHWTGRDLANLRGLYNALSDRMVELGEIFGGLQGPSAEDAQVFHPESLAGDVRSEDMTQAPTSQSGPRGVDHGRTRPRGRR